MSQTEVKSRLRALADTIDSRGWAVKTPNFAQFGAAQQPFAPVIGQQPASSDRLLEVSATTVQPVITTDIQAADDMMDEKANPRAQKMDSMISASAQAHRQKLIDELNKPTNEPVQQPAADYWFLKQPSQQGTVPRDKAIFGTQVVTPGATQSSTTPITQSNSSPVDEAALVHELDEHREAGPTSSYYGHLKMIQPLSAQHSQTAKPTTQPSQATLTFSPAPPPPPVTPTQQAAILQLARNDDLNVATIAREANKNNDGEVVINLH